MRITIRNETVLRLFSDHADQIAALRTRRYLDTLVEVVSLIVVALKESASEVLDDGADFSALMLLGKQAGHASGYSDSGQSVTASPRRKYKPYLLDVVTSSELFSAVGNFM